MNRSILERSARPGRRHIIALGHIAPRLRSAATLSRPVRMPGKLRPPAPGYVRICVLPPKSHCFCDYRCGVEGNGLCEFVFYAVTTNANMRAASAPQQKSNHVKRRRLMKTPPRYEKKFGDFIRLCAEAKANGSAEVVVHYPWVLGDTYEELIESLSRLADAGLLLHVAARKDWPSNN